MTATMRWTASASTMMGSGASTTTTNRLAGGGCRLEINGRTVIDVVSPRQPVGGVDTEPIETHGLFAGAVD